MTSKNWRPAPLLALLAVLVVVGCEDEPEPYCPTYFKMCSDVCTNTFVDSRNCGDCGNVCGTAEGEL